ncbi:pilus assembly protein N-terminal domain-containing protein [Pigmentiphaga soli]|uniref:Pilus assembly protein N-terminal domain-containing protein n=2 Tax=Pigmentiphaga soli TaxID=1007095 RepID=A0ABP8H9X6_9BURK
MPRPSRAAGFAARAIALWLAALLRAAAAGPAALDPFVDDPSLHGAVMPWEAGLSGPPQAPVGAAEPSPSAPPASPDAGDIELFVGETRVLPAPDVARIAVGNGRVVHASTADDKEVILFGNTPGASSLVVWKRDGSAARLHVTVTADDTRRVQQELAAFLERIPTARSTVVGDKIIVEGDDLSDADYAKVAVLARRYPQIVDFTGQIGWERMVMMDVKVVEIPHDRLQQLGVRWDPTSTGGLQAGFAWDAAASGRLRRGPQQDAQARPGGGPLALPFPSLGPAGYAGIDALLSARIDALAQSGEAVVLAQPQLSARSGSTARFMAGGEVPYATIDRNGSSNTTFKPYGVSLEITPRVDRSGTVRSVIEVEVSTVDPAVTAPGGPALKVRRTSTEFNVRSGQTLVLSGFLSREQASDTDGIPGLSGLPILGALFRSRRFQQRETELAIFVTPVVVSHDDAPLRERVERAERLLDQTFGPPRLDVPLRPDASHAIGSIQRE